MRKKKRSKVQISFNIQRRREVGFHRNKNGTLHYVLWNGTGVQDDV